MTRAGRWALGLPVTLLIIVAVGLWIRNSIEWVDVDVRTPKKELEQRDPFATAQALITRLGSSAESKPGLATMPPPGATLVLATRHWMLFPARLRAVERWVRAGGRLVLLPGAWSDAKEAPAWLPVQVVDIPRRRGKAASSADSDDDDDDDEASSAADSDTASAPAAGDGSVEKSAAHADKNCSFLHEPSAAMAAYGGARAYQVCGHASRRLRTTGVAPTWALDLPDGSIMLRAPLGQGSVTISTLSFSFIGDSVLDHDSALAFAAALSLRAGDIVWFVADEKSISLLARMWASGKSVILLGLLALALALWRGATRFGPPAAEAATARRSIGEQIRRTAGFIAGGGGIALHQASVRALEESARRWVGGYAALLGVEERARAIAAATGLDATALAAALAPIERADVGSAAGRRRRIGAAIGLLEQARRALRALGPDPSTPPRATS